MPLLAPDPVRTLAAPPAATSPRAAARLHTADEALDAARRLAALWQNTAAEIDATRRVPREETAALDASGLLAITVPDAHGGPGLPNSVLTRVFRILAATDTALAQIAQNHFDFVDALAVAAPETQDLFYFEVLSGRRFGNAIAERGRRSRRDLATTIVEDGTGYRINGVKAFCTGALTAAWVPVLALHADRRIRTVYVERNAHGLDVRSDWDAFGQRATFSGTTVVDEVWVPASHVVDRSLGDPALLLAQFAGNQLIHAAIEVGTAEGALHRAARLGGPVPDEETAARLGGWAVRIGAARALVDRAARRVDAALAAANSAHASGGDELAVAAAIAVDAAKSLAYPLGPAITAALSGFARTPDELAEADRHWRNARTHSLHDPVRWRQFNVGNFDLNGRLPATFAERFHAVERLEASEARPTAPAHPASSPQGARP